MKIEFIAGKDDKTPVFWYAATDDDRYDGTGPDILSAVYALATSMEKALSKPPLQITERDVKLVEEIEHNLNALVQRYIQEYGQDVSFNMRDVFRTFVHPDLLPLIKIFLTKPSFDTNLAGIICDRYARITDRNAFHQKREIESFFMRVTDKTLPEFSAYIHSIGKKDAL